jgi:hypothetical protein
MSVKVTFQVTGESLSDLVMETSQLLAVLPSPGTTITMDEKHSLALVVAEWDSAEQTVLYFESRFSAGPE